MNRHLQIIKFVLMLCMMAAPQQVVGEFPFSVKFNASILSDVQSLTRSPLLQDNKELLMVAGASVAVGTLAYKAYGNIDHKVTQRHIDTVTQRLSQAVHERYQRGIGSYTPIPARGLEIAIKLLAMPFIVVKNMIITIRDGVVTVFAWSNGAEAYSDDSVSNTDEASTSPNDNQSNGTTNTSYKVVKALVANQSGAFCGAHMVKDAKALIDCCNNAVGHEQCSRSNNQNEMDCKLANIAEKDDEQFQKICEYIVEKRQPSYLKQTVIATQKSIIDINNSTPTLFPGGFFAFLLGKPRIETDMQSASYLGATEDEKSSWCSRILDDNACSVRDELIEKKDTVVYKPADFRKKLLQAIDIYRKHLLTDASFVKNNEEKIKEFKEKYEVKNSAKTKSILTDKDFAHQMISLRIRYLKDTLMPNVNLKQPITFAHRLCDANWGGEDELGHAIEKVGYSDLIIIMPNLDDGCKQAEGFDFLKTEFDGDYKKNIAPKIKKNKPVAFLISDTQHGDNGCRESGHWTGTVYHDNTYYLMNSLGNRSIIDDPRVQNKIKKLEEKKTDITSY